MKEQQGQFQWGEMQGSLNKIIEQNQWQQRNLAEFRHLYNTRTTSRRQYDINTQLKLNYLCNVVAALNPGYPTFMQSMEELILGKKKYWSNTRKMRGPTWEGWVFGSPRTPRHKKDSPRRMVMTPPQRRKIKEKGQWIEAAQRLLSPMVASDLLKFFYLIVCLLSSYCLVFLCLRNFFMSLLSLRKKMLFKFQHKSIKVVCFHGNQWWVVRKQE